MWRAKKCQICGTSFQPTGPAAKYCAPCGKVYRADLARKLQYEWRVRTGYTKNPGVGSGGAQGFGPEHHSFKPDAPNRYKDHVKAECERCGSKSFLCGHHKDRDRGNNEPSNIETLCKRCHQIEHGCANHLPKVITQKQRNKLSRNASNNCKTLKRRADGTFISPKEKK